MCPAVTSKDTSLRAYTAPKRLVSFSTARQVLLVTGRSSMTSGPAQEVQTHQRVARDQPIRANDHHQDENEPVNDQPLRILEIEEAIEEIVDAVHWEEIGPGHRDKLQPFTQRTQELRQECQYRCAGQRSPVGTAAADH